MFYICSYLRPEGELNWEIKSGRVSQLLFNNSSELSSTERKEQACWTPVIKRANIHNGDFENEEYTDSSKLLNPQSSNYIMDCKSLSQTEISLADMPFHCRLSDVPSKSPSIVFNLTVNRL